MTKAIVTGSEGFIGGHLTDRLLQLGIKVLGIDDMSNGVESTLESHLDSPNFISEQIDILDPAIKSIFKSFKPQYVFHLAAKAGVAPSVAMPAFSDLNNTNGTVNLLEASKNSNVKRFIFSSSSSVYGGTKKLPTEETATLSPESPYALQKLIGEKYCSLFYKLYNLDTVSLRYFNVFGPRQRADSAYAAVIAAFCNAEKNGIRPIIYGNGEQFRDFCYVQNVVDANIKSALEAGPLRGQRFNIGCGGKTTVNELCSTICSKEPIYEKERPGDVFSSQADITWAKRMIGYHGEITFEEGIQEALKWYLGS
jgi:nucleoside-diphosphate-sugar epimerase